MKPRTPARIAALSALTLLAFACLLVVAPAIAAADTIYVDVARGNDIGNDGTVGRPYRSIRKGLFEAAYGDTVKAAAGEYSAATGETFPLNVPVGVTLQGDRSPWTLTEPLLGTRIDGDDVSSVLLFSNANQDTGVDGVFITANTIAGNGGAISVLGGSIPGYGPFIRDCVFYANTAASGGAISVNRAGAAACSVTIDRCLIVGCSATTGSGGGVDATDASVTITDSILLGCSAPNGQGGGADIQGAGQSLISGTSFMGCSAPVSQGGGICATNQSIHVKESDFLACSAQLGGGICVWDTVAPYPEVLLVENCVFDTNQAANSGGAIRSNRMTTNVRNCTFRNNTAVNVGGGIAQYDLPISVYNSILWGNGDELSITGGAVLTLGYSCVEDLGDTGAGVTHNDPMLTTTSEAARPLPGSPCIDTGTNAFMTAMDREDRPRPADGDGNGSAIVDMGAYERSPYVDRAAGATRYATAVAASEARFPIADTVVLATGQAYPDALCASALAGAVQGPVLLTSPTSLPAEVSAELTRLEAEKVYIVGGTAAVSETVADQLRDAGYQVERISGADRYATSRFVAEKIESLLGAMGYTYVLVARGDAFPDALSASPLAWQTSIPILLTKPNELPSATSSAITAIGATDAIVVGGESAVSPAVFAALEGLLPGTVERVYGADRYETSVAFVEWARASMHFGGIFHDDYVGLATGLNFPDALCGGPVCGRSNGPLLLVRYGSVPPSVAGYIEDNADTMAHVQVFGGTAAVTEGVLTEIRALIP